MCDLTSQVADRGGMAASMLPCCVAMCVDRCGFAARCCETPCSGCMDVAWALFWEVVGARHLVFFGVKWMQPTMKGTSCVRRLRAMRFDVFFVPSLLLWLQAALVAFVCTHM